MMVMYNEKKWQRAVLGNNKAFWGMGLLWITSFVALLYDGKLTGTYSISVKPTSIVYAVLSFLLIYIVVYKIRIPHFGWTQHLKKWSEWVAKSSFLVYLVHPLCLNLLVKMSVWFGIPFIFYKERGLLLLFIATTICTLTGIYLIQKTPFSYWLGGTSTMKRKRKQLLIGGESTKV